MDKIYVVYWSQSGNTQAMAEAIGRGITAAGKEAVVQFVSEASIDDLKNASVYALGCLQWVQKYWKSARWSHL